MLVGTLVLSLACGLSAGAAAATAGAPLWVAALAVVAAANLAMIGLALVRLAVGARAHDAWDAHGEAFEAALPGQGRQTG